MKKIRIILLAVLAYIATYIFNSELAIISLKNSLGFLIEMFKVLPPVMVLTGLLSVWVPTKVIESNLGEKSGIKGTFFSILMGAFSSGPIYAAFPAVTVLLKKGASIKNSVIILSSWAVIKIPMLFVESSFLGLNFAIKRYIITLPLIIVIGLIMDKFVRKENIIPEQRIITLPNLNCRGCGFKNCNDFKSSIESGESEIEKCIILKNTN